ncbi:MAG: osmotically inducible protein OsmC [Firmicutes bacterium]|nr:osmotically inducible protein OsmC [Bacillota bacterium]
MRIRFPGGKKVDVHYKGFTVKTDQPEASGGNNSAPSPFDLFLCSIGACAGFYVLDFCQGRNIPYEDIELILTPERNESKGLIGKINIEIKLPAEFPEKYRDAVVRAAGLCAVKKHLDNPPEFQIQAALK